MAKEIKIKLKFDIGDEVVFKGTQGKKRKLRFKKDETDPVGAQVFKVTDRFIEECYGGIQVHYNLRPMMYSSLDVQHDEVFCVGVHKELFKAREIELEEIK